MIAFCVRRPTLVAMFFLAVVLLGVISYKNLAVEGQPDVELPQLVISARWPNTPPEVVQVFLTSPIEEVSAQLEGLEEMTSSSTTREGCRVTLKFNRDADMEFARLDLNERLSKLRSDLPPGASQPTVSSVARDEIESNALLSLSVSGPFGLEKLSEVVEDEIKTAISSVEGVAEVYIYGIRERELKVQLDREAMDLYGLVPDTVANKIAEMTRTYETGRARYENKELTITIKNSIPNLASLMDLIIQQRQDRVVRVRDVGSATIGYADMQSLSRINGNPTLTVTVEKEVGANLIETGTNVKKVLEELQPRLPEGTRIDWVSDEAKMMKEQLSSVYWRAIWCVGLIVVLLLIFLRSISAAAVISLNILFSVLITINFMYYFDITFNIVTLSGLAIGFGMLVDNAIVVLENIFRHRELGATRPQAAIKGAEEVVWAIFASTLTTVASFCCMFWLEDRLSVAYTPLVLSVVFSLSASLLVSFTFTPLLSLFIRGNAMGSKVNKPNAYQRITAKMLHGFTELYGRLVTLVLNHKLMIISICGLMLFWANSVYDEMEKGSFSFFFGSQDTLRVFVRMPEGAELETADEVMRQFEEPLLGVTGYKDMSVRVTPTVAFMEIFFEKDMLQSSFPLVLKSRLIGIAQGFAGVSLGVMGITQDDNYFVGNLGMETYNSSIRILGYNYKKLTDYGNDILARIRRNRRVKETNIKTMEGFRFSQDQTETVLVIDRDSLRNHAIDIQYLIGFIATNLKLESRNFTRFQGEEMLLKVKFDNADSFDIKALENLTIRTADNQRIRLADMVSLETRKVPGGIGRKDQQYSMLLQWEFRGSQKKADAYRMSVYNSLELPPGFSKELEASRDLTENEQDSIKFVVIAAIVLVLMIMAALYESIVDPFVILMTVPLSFIGVVWIYWYTDKSFDSTSYIGLVILAGIVVNNSILLVTHINEKIRELPFGSSEIVPAVVQACKDRLRPILLTALTTIIGLLPLLEDFVQFLVRKLYVVAEYPVIGVPFQALANLLAKQGDGEMANQGLDQTISMFASLSRSTVGGMLMATISTLFVIPVVYMVLFRFKQWLNQRINECFAGQPPELPPIEEGQTET